METAAISHRVADFLKQYPPFHEIEEPELLELARHGRVRFYEKNQYVLAQGSSRVQILVIQQGTVLLWDERGEEAKLLDIRGTGDLLGVDQIDGFRTHPYAARSASDVLIYAFPVGEFNSLVERYPLAKQYVSAYGSSANYRSFPVRQGPETAPLSAASGRSFAVCGPEVSIREAARVLVQSGTDALVIDDPQRGRSMLQANRFLEWIANGGTDLERPVRTMATGPVIEAGPDFTVADGVLAMAETGAAALAITLAGSERGQLESLVSSSDIGRVFGDRPLEILAAIPRAQNVSSLRDLNKRARELVLRYLNGAVSSDWLARFTSLTDVSIVRKVIAMAAPETGSQCWCLYGPAGTAENLASVAPQVLLISAEETAEPLQRVRETLGECGYLPNSSDSFEPSFYAAPVNEWRLRYGDWVTDPILEKFYQARPLFDLRPVFGDESLFRSVEATVDSALNREFLHIIANDCLSTIPPVTFFKNAVIDEVGEETSIFRLEEHALRPLVDVARVFGLAAKKVFRTSTIERFRIARELLPEHASIFEEAEETVRILLWQQGRAGISQNTSGAEIPPALLGPYDRQLLRKGFRSILRLIEFTGDLEWLKRL